MIESIDQILDGETPSCGLLEGYSCYEMNLLMEAITDTESTGSLSDEELQTAIIASAKKNADGNLNSNEKNELENDANDPKIINQNKDSAKELSLKVGQQVDTVDPTTSERKTSQLSGVDTDKGLAFLKNASGEIDIEPASKIQMKA